MRNTKRYRMRVLRDLTDYQPHSGVIFSIPVPLELVEGFDGVDYVKWEPNEDGTYTITLYDPA